MLPQRGSDQELHVVVFLQVGLLLSDLVLEIATEEVSAVDRRISTLWTDFPFAIRHSKRRLYSFPLLCVTLVQYLS